MAIPYEHRKNDKKVKKDKNKTKKISRREEMGKVIIHTFSGQLDMRRNMSMRKNRNKDKQEIL